MATSRRYHGQYDHETLARARAQDELERFVHGLTQQYAPAVLESLLRALGDASTRLVNEPPLVAAMRFRDTALRCLRISGLSAGALQELVVENTEGATTELAPSASLERLFDRAILVFGLRRGGNHAITEWLRGHFPAEATLYLNSAEPSLFETSAGALTIDRDKYFGLRVEPGVRVLVVGYENIDPAAYPLAYNRRVAVRTDAVVVLRDYPNTAASIVKQAHDDPAFAYRFRIRDLLDLWPRYASYFATKAFGCTYVSFNEWFTSLSARSAIARDLDLEPSDRGLNSVSSFGLGSSFDGVNLDGRAQEMDVLGRWRQMLEDPLFRFLLVADPDALEFSRALFGEFPFTREVLLDAWREGKVPS